MTPARGRQAARRSAHPPRSSRVRKSAKRARRRPDRYSPPGRPRAPSNPEKPTPDVRYSDDRLPTDNTTVHSGQQQPTRWSSQSVCRLSPPVMTHIPFASLQCYCVAATTAAIPLIWPCRIHCPCMVSMNSFFCFFECQNLSFSCTYTI